MRHLQNPIRVVVMCALVAVAVAVSGQEAWAQGPLRPVEAVVINAPSQPLPTVAGLGVTHLGVPLADHVMLVGFTSATGACGTGQKTFVRMSSDGSRESTAFVVPEGRSLVVLDVDAVLVTNDLRLFDVGDSVGASLLTPSNMNTGVFMFHTTNAVLITVPGMKAVSVSSSLAAGVVFGPGQQVCMRAEVRSFGGGFSPNGSISNAAVRGYLR